MICAPNSAVDSYSIDYTNDKNIKNWVEQLDLVCVGDNKIGLIGSSFFIGWSMFALVSPPLADRYGRKKVVLASYTVFVLVSYSILMSTSLDLTIYLMFFLGCTVPGLMNVGFVYANELLSQKQQI